MVVSNRFLFSFHASSPRAEQNFATFLTHKKHVNTKGRSTHQWDLKDVLFFDMMKKIDWHRKM